MTDRFTLHASKKEIERLFDVSSDRQDYFDSNYNISPGSLCAIVVNRESGHELEQARWGLIPPSADDEREGIDHRSVAAEKLQEHDWYAECLQQRRCLVPANGFYKWKTSKKAATPFYIRLLSNELTAFAGIYRVWTSPNGRDVYSFAILTTSANTLVEPVDDRMPVLLKRSDFERWLKPGEVSAQMQQALLLQPYSLTKMAVNRVSEQVNDINNNSPQLIQPIPK